ncbi:carbamate kinase [Oscillospiraceae bacterium MB08-C2-2]|nr:carbamate kinase [Oscillospiraceae bacterium MB08-C2-2]
MRTVVIAIGGNAITQSGQKGTIAEQHQNIVHCCNIIADLVEAGDRIILTHGNGPQVGSIVLQNDIAKHTVPENPLDICGAQTQGSLGYMISQTLMNLLSRRRLDKKVATVLTQVVVDEKDSAFQNPTKFIGPFFNEEEAEMLGREKGFCMRKDSDRGYRRVVASPMPLELVERDAIEALLEKNFLLITVGGGGIPVIRTKDGDLQGVEAVIDKDFASAMVACAVHADILVILTGVAKVALGYGTPDQKELDSMTVSQCREYLCRGEFPEGSMGPKIRAAMQFVEAGGGQALITSIEHMQSALEGQDGTRILPEEQTAKV